MKPITKAVVGVVVLGVLPSAATMFTVHVDGMALQSLGVVIGLVWLGLGLRLVTSSWDQQYALS